MAELLRVDFPRFRVREVGYAAGGRMERHAHGFSNVTAVISGEMEETTEAEEHRGRSCSVLLKPRDTAHRNRWLGRRGTRCVTIEFTDAWDVASWQWIESAGAARATLTLLRALRGASRDAIESAAVALVETALAATAHAAQNAPAWIDEARRVLEQRFEQRFGERLRFDELARGFGLHPVYAARAFRRHTGTTMGDYVRALRLRQARHLLSATERPLGALSAECGFSDASHLCRVFADAHGIAPREFRRLLG